MELRIKKHPATSQQMVELWEVDGKGCPYLMCICHEDHFADLDCSEDLYYGKEIILDVRRKQP